MAMTLCCPGATSCSRRAAGPGACWDRPSPRTLQPHRRVLGFHTQQRHARLVGAAVSQDEQIGLRSEAEAPFRSLRLVLFGFSVVSAGVGFLVSIPQLIGALGGAPNALALGDVQQNIAINLGAVGIFAFLFRQDWQARDRQIARLTREEKLGALPLRLANGKKLRVAQLRGSARCVLVAGTYSQVAAALEAAAPFKEDLIKRGVLVVPLPLYGSADEGVSLPSLTPADLRWCCEPLRLDEWQSWFSQQLSMAKSAKLENGLFVGLRLDGRVRSSGSGMPPWRRYALELAPLEGADGWTGFFDGFDGRV